MDGVRSSTKLLTSVFPETTGQVGEELFSKGNELQGLVFPVFFK